MFILLKDRIVGASGSTAFGLGISRVEGKVTAWVYTRDGGRIECENEDDAHACLQALAYELNAQEWNSQARCFVSVRYRPDDVGAILQYMSEESFPSALVRDVAWLVGTINWSEESHAEITGFIGQMREKYP